MASIKNYFLITVQIIFFVTSMSAQKATKVLPCLNYEITNDILIEEIDLFVKNHEKEYKKDKVISFSVNFDIKERVLIYRIYYTTNFDFFNIGKKKFKYDYPTMVTKLNEHYVFVNFFGFNDISIDKDLMFEIGKICFPNDYQLYLKDTLLYSSSHDEPMVVLKFKFDGTFIGKEIR
jgi:hypothetical protein